MDKENEIKENQKDYNSIHNLKKRFLKGEEMGKQIKTIDGVVELDEGLVELFKLNSYSIEYRKTKACGNKKVLDDGGHYCINTMDLEENELGAEDILDDSEILALYLQKNGYGNIEQAVREFAEEAKQFVVFCKLENKKLAKEKDLAQLINDILQQVGNHIDELIKKRFGEEVHKE